MNECPVAPMYRIKPVFSLDALTINSPMYAMKSVHASCAAPHEEKTGSTDNNLLQNVECRQKELLKFLAQIKEQLAFIRQHLSSEKDTVEQAQSKMTCNERISTPNTLTTVFPELVLNASVHHPPYSLLGFEKLWKRKVKLSCHVHSSLNEVPEQLKVFQELQGSGDTSDIGIRLVWKNMTSDCELVVSPAKYISLQGEVNLLRFIQRHLENSLGPLEEAEVNEKLDLCHKLKFCSSNKEATMVLSEIMSDNHKARWILGNQLSIVDIAAWSAVKSFKNLSLNKKWSTWLKNLQHELGVDS